MSSASIINTLNRENTIQQQQSIDYLYLTTNEVDSEIIQSQLSKRKVIGNAIFGVSAFNILNLASIRRDKKITHIVSIDISAKLQIFWPSFEKIMNESNCSDSVDACRESVVIKIIAFLVENREVFFSGHFQDNTEVMTNISISSFCREIKEGKSWLSTGERFARIKEIFDHKAFSFHSVDFFNKTEIKNIFEIYKTKNIIPDTVYISNLTDCAVAYNKFDEFREAMQQIPKSIYFILASHIDQNRSNPLRMKLIDPNEVETETES